MLIYEYKVIPAPKKGLNSRGVKGPEGRFSNAIEAVLNDLARKGWEFLRAEVLPNEERSGLTGRKITYQNMLVFRRQTEAGALADDDGSDILAGYGLEEVDESDGPEPEPGGPPKKEPTFKKLMAEK